MVQPGVYGRVLTAGLVCLWILITFVSTSSIDNDQLDVCTENTTDARCCLCDQADNCTNTCPDGFNEKNSTLVTCSGYSTTTQQTSTLASTSEATSVATSESTSSPNTKSGRDSVRICVTPCSKGEFYNETESRCMPCDPECITCNVSQSTCIKCKFSYKNKCFEKCPPNTHPKPFIQTTTTVAMTTVKQDSTTEGSVENSTNSSTVSETTSTIVAETVSTQGTDVSSGSPTTVASREQYDEGDVDDETIQCVDIVTVPTATDEPQKNGKLIGAIGGGVAAFVAVVVVMIIIIVVVVRRRRMHSCTEPRMTADDTKGKSRMSTLLDQRKGKKPANVETGDMEMGGTGGQNQPRDYENIQSVNPNPIAIERQTDKVTRYIKDPTANMDVERRHQPTNGNRDASSIYENAAMVHLTENVKLDNMAENDIEKALQTEEEREELQELGQAPAPPVIRADAKNRPKQKDLPNFPAGPTEDYIDMSHGDFEEEPYENVTINRGETQNPSMSRGKTGMSMPKKPPGGSTSRATANETVTSSAADDGPTEDYEEMDNMAEGRVDAKADTDALEDYENTGSMARGKVGPKVGTGKAGSKVDGVDVKSDMDDLEDYENTGVIARGKGGAQGPGNADHGSVVVHGTRQEDGEELYENTMEDYMNVQIKRN